MNDSGDSQVPGNVGDLMSEVNAKRLKEAEGALLIGDGTPIWLLNILSTIAGSPSEHEHVFLAIVYILMYESGFYFVDGPHNGTITYDVRLMRDLCDPTIILKNIKKDNSQYITKFSHNLMYPKCIKIIAYPLNNFFKLPSMVINFYLPDVNKVSTFTFDLKAYLTNDLKLYVNKCKDLSIQLKSFLYSFKSDMCVDTYHPHHIFALPPHILQLLCKYLGGRSFVMFMQTCKYMYDNYNDDEILWKYHSLIDFRGLNKKPNETWKAHYRYQTEVGKMKRVMLFSAFTCGDIT